MSPDTLFSIANAVALIGWLILAAGVLLRRPLLRDTIAGTAVPVALSACYAGLVLVNWWSADGGFDSLAAVQTLFSQPWIALAGWVHYLAFDLFIGATLARRVMENGLTRMVLLLILPLTFLFGPVGLLVAQGLFLIRKRQTS